MTVGLQNFTGSEDAVLPEHHYRDAELQQQRHYWNDHIVALVPMSELRWLA